MFAGRLRHGHTRPVAPCRSQHRATPITTQQRRAADAVERERQNGRINNKDAAALLALVSRAVEQLDLLPTEAEPSYIMEYLRNLSGPAAPTAGGAEYLELLNARLIAPSAMGTLWEDFQEQEGGPLYYCHRPHYANRGPPAVLMHPAFAAYVESARSGEVSSRDYQFVVKAAEQMSLSFVNTTTDSALRCTQPVLGDKHKGVARGGEDLRAQTFCRLLLQYLRDRCKVPPLTLQPAIVHKAFPEKKTDGSCCVGSAQHADLAHILLIEAKEGEDSGMFQLLHYYHHLVATHKHNAAVMNTCYPALGLELCGDCVRVSALYLADKICYQPLTPLLHLADMRMSTPDYAEVVVRALAALPPALDMLHDTFQPYCAAASLVSGGATVAAAGPSAAPTSAHRDPELIAGVPYQLRNRFESVERLKDLVFRCEDKLTGKLTVAKFVPTRSYPAELHREAASSGCVPELVADIEQQPGGFTLVHSEYLDPGNGWQQLSANQRVAAAPEACQAAGQEALAKLHACCNGKAVHGDPREPNLFLRVMPRTRAGPGIDAPQDDPKVEMRLIDLDWSGVEGTAVYPPYINPQLQWAIPNPGGQQIMQSHDREVLKRSLDTLAGMCSAG